MKLDVEVKKATSDVDTASNGGYSVQKQVKQKILQAQQAKCSNLQKKRIFVPFLLVIGSSYKSGWFCLDIFESYQFL